MGQVSKVLRRAESGYTHWCPACLEMHPLPDSWDFNGDVDCPTFTPSFKHEGVVTEKDENGNWTGEWVRDSDGNPIKFICHYILTDGILNFCGDCSHDMKNLSVPMVELPAFYKDKPYPNT